MEQQIIQQVYEMLKNRKINPSGQFDSAGRFYAKNGELINVRQPSRHYPYSQMVACRTKKYVKAVAEYYNCKTEQELLANI